MLVCRVHVNSGTSPWTLSTSASQPYDTPPNLEHHSVHSLPGVMLSALTHDAPHPVSLDGTHTRQHPLMLS